MAGSDHQSKTASRAPSREQVVVRFPGPPTSLVAPQVLRGGRRHVFAPQRLDHRLAARMIAGRSVPAYTALHKVDVLSKQDATRVRSLIRKP